MHRITSGAALSTRIRSVSLTSQIPSSKKRFFVARCQGWACANLDFFFLPGAVSSQLLKKNKFKAANILYIVIRVKKVEISLLAVSLCSCGALVGTVGM